MTIESLRDLKETPRVFVYATGAGAGIQKKLWEVPGCSSFLIGCGFPYASEITSKYIGLTPDKFVSVDTSLHLAMSAYMKAYDTGHPAIGVGLTASVASMSEHRGAHRVIVSTFSDTECLSFTTEIPKGFGLSQRSIDGYLSDEIGIAAILRAANLAQDAYIPNEYDAFKYEMDPIHFNPFDSSVRAKELILSSSFFTRNGMHQTPESIDRNKVIYYPGSFNPYHWGHELGADAIRQTVARKFGECRDVVFTTVINPPHKEELPVFQMLSRASTMNGKDFCLTVDDPLFIDKAKRVPGAWFGIGADALATMLDPKWGHSVPDLLTSFSNLNTKMFVMGRLVKNDFICLDDIKKIHPIINEYEHLFIDVPGRWDISSTELRNKR